MLSAARSRLQGSSSGGDGTLSPRHFSTSATSPSPRSPSSIDGARPSAGSRTASGSQQPIEDLRRRLALGGAGHGGFNASLHSLVEGTEADATSPTKGPFAERLELHRTVSTTSTEASEATTATSGSTNTTTGATMGAGAGGLSIPKTRTKVRLSGGVEVGRVAPAVAEDSTNAMGLFDVEARYRASLGGAAGGEGDAASLAGEAAPTSVAAFRMSGGAGGEKVVLPQRFVSTYGTFRFFFPSPLPRRD
jgi:phosphoinositide-3-kinase regulatory subunit 4